MTACWLAEAIGEAGALRRLRRLYLCLNAISDVGGAALMDALVAAAETDVAAGMLDVSEAREAEVETAGVPLAKLLFPELVPYVFVNQSIQLVLVNPILLALMELGRSSGRQNALRSALQGVARNPLVVMTLAGLLAGQLFAAGLPPLLASLSKQIADSGPFLGFLSLGFACASLGSTSTLELQHCHGRVFLDGGSNTGDSVRAFLSGFDLPAPA